MASSQSTHNNAATDIIHVLESLGSLMGELDAIEIDKGADGVERNNNYAIDHDLSLETLLADMDEFDDDDEQQFLIPCEKSPVEKSPGFLSHKSHHDQNFNSSTQGRVGSANGCPVCDVPTSGAKSKEISTSQSRSLKLDHSASLRTHEHDGNYSVPSAARSKGISTSQSSSFQSRNFASLGTQANDSHYAVPPSRGGHKGAFKEVALGGDVHGSFKKVDKGSLAATAKTTVQVPISHPKAQANHYVAPGELGLPTASHGNVKSDVGGKSLVHGSQQMKQDSAQQVPVNVFNEDNKAIGLLVSSTMKANEACYKLALLSKVDADPHWVLVEHLTDLVIERNLEDHENVMAVLNTWAPGSNNKLLFRKDIKKYHFFAHTASYFPPHLLDSEHSDKAVTEKAQKAKTILHQKLFSTCTRVPEIEGTLHCKEFGKKSWSKKFLFLRGSGFYSSVKGKSKASKDLESYVQFDGANLYNILNPKKSHKAPTEFCFCIVPFRARELKELKCFCVEDEKSLMSWMMAVRIAKFGPQLRQNYDDMLRKFAKLTKYRDQQTSAKSRQNVRSEREEGDTCTKEGQVAMDFTGERGRVITDGKEIQELANTRNKAKYSRRTSSQHFIPTDTAVPGHYFMSEPWYHGRITREHSLELLVAAGAQDGVSPYFSALATNVFDMTSQRFSVPYLFLVRESSSVAGVFVLTFCMNRRVYHCQLVQDIGEGTHFFFSLGKGPAFKTLHQLIHYYQQKPLNGVSLALRTPCPKSTVETVDEIRTCSERY